MSVTLEKIEILREKANVSYAEAKEILEKSNGDVLEAILLLEKDAKIRRGKSEIFDCCSKNSKGVMGTVKKVINKGNNTKFVISKEGNVVTDMPVTLLALITAAVPPLTVAGVLAAMVTNHKISFVKPDGTGMKINDTLNKVSTSVNNVSNQVVDAIKED